MKPDPSDAWHAEHVYFGKLLRLLQRELDVFHAGERPNYELMLDVISYLSDFADRLHHPREDVAFARLAKRCPELELALARLRQEHGVIAQAGEKLRGLLAAALDGAFVKRAEIEMAAAMYLVYYGNHIAKVVRTMPLRQLARAEDIARAARQLLATVARRSLELLAELESSSLHHSAQRLAVYLGSLAESSNGNGDGVRKVRLPETKTLIASRLDMKKETLSRLLRTLACRGLIEVNGADITLLDPAKLAEIA